MGYIRFLLAVIVVMVHANASISPSIGSLAAVQAFFIISGFYMAATYERNYSGAGAAFWMSRFLRLYPTYLIVLLLTFLAWKTIHSESGLQLFSYFETDGSKPRIAVWTLLFQDLVSVNETDHYLLPVRQAWSISAELAFYFFVPLLVRLKRFCLVLALTGFVLKAALFYAISWRWSYFSFFGEIGYFIAGMWLYFNRSLITWSKQTAFVIAVMFCAYALLGGTAGWEQTTTIRNAGLIVATMIMLPSCFEHLNGRASNFLGDISYGVYIAQFLAIEVLTDLHLINVDDPLSRISRFVFVVALSIALATFVDILIQKPIDGWRRKLLRSKPIRSDDREKLITVFHT